MIGYIIAFFAGGIFGMVGISLLVSKNLAEKERFIKELKMHIERLDEDRRALEADIRWHRKHQVGRA